MNHFSDFIRDWGYWAVFFGAMVEGEAVILMASAFAAYEYLSIYYVFLISFITTVIADQGLFWMGYKMGTEWVTKKFPKIAKVRDKIFNLLYQMDALFIFSFRFMYGIRIASPIIIGAAHVKPSRFAFYNTLSGLTWAFIVCFIGYTIADVVMDGRFDNTPPAFAITVLIIVVSFAIGLWFRVKKVNKPTPNDPHKGSDKIPKNPDQ
jgi:membrane protein DedA with SNARE-associated domain